MASARRVLIVDDDRDAGSALAAMVEELGMRPIRAWSGAEALRLAQAEPPEIVLLDIGLGDVDGFALARVLRGDPVTAPARIVAVSGLAAGAIGPSARAAGCDGVLTKPVSLEMLSAAIRNLPLTDP